MRKPAVIGFVVVLLAAAISHAQEAPQFPKPQKEHQWLQEFVGQWETTSKVSAGVDKSFECIGTINGRMVGGFWIVNEMKAEMMGAPFVGIQTIGYDPAKKKYIGTWVDSMMNYMWRYEGTVNKAGTKITLEAVGPNFAGEGKDTKYRDTYEFKSADHIVITSSTLGKDGKWTTFMSGEAKRVKTEARK